MGKRPLGPRLYIEAKGCFHGAAAGYSVGETANSNIYSNGGVDTASQLTVVTYRSGYEGSAHVWSHVNAESTED
ncbi:MAG: hypothetical protein QXY49_04680 [Thermofilaceae archaeon]